ncbi:hypothetical protein L873DRAFT_1514032 [Choiromyces venosus 120613-1]|uniref:Uncharacterized protein n=1 Tax=Choiromyces venosus 120613-1 TaxID=1336337 RepID=A0A3N4J5K1_9PEZI|nr:hypothetical protein L873DRAFT_1514032 [Choiromyces venosus 120613-1]
MVLTVFLLNSVLSIQGPNHNVTFFPSNFTLVALAVWQHFPYLGFYLTNGGSQAGPKAQSNYVLYHTTIFEKGRSDDLIEHLIRSPPFKPEPSCPLVVRVIRRGGAGDGQFRKGTKGSNC